MVEQKPVVLLMHGIIDSTDGLMVNGRENSVAFFLHDAGYDVWAANSRCNHYSTEHAYLDPETDAKFW